MLAVYVLFFERGDGVKAAFRRLWPYAALEIGLTAIRGAQILMAGSATKAGVLGRSIEPNIEAWFTVAPGALVAQCGHSSTCFRST